MKSISARLVIVGLLAVLAALAIACDSTAPAGEPGATPASAPTVDVTPPSPTPTTTPVPMATAVPDPTATPAPMPPSIVGQLTGVPGIVDPTNLGWPRSVEGLYGVIEIPEKPKRVITASVGHDELFLAIAPLSRLVGVGFSTTSPTYSNVASLVSNKPVISQDPETIIALSPDVIVTSPYFPSDGIAALESVGIPVVQTQLEHDAEARIGNILLMGYILGEEARALEFAGEVTSRYEALTTVTQRQDDKPRVLAITSYSDNLWVAGDGSTEGSVIDARQVGSTLRPQRESRVIRSRALKA